MLEHYLMTALRQFRRHKLTTLVNVAGLALGLACFVIPYSLVSYLKASERAFPNSPRTFVISMSFLNRDSGAPDVTMPMTPSVLAKYLKADFPELDAVARAVGGVLMGSSDGNVLRTGNKTASVYVVYADNDFLHIFDLPFVAGAAKDALAKTNSVVLTGKTAEQLFGTRGVVGRTVRLNGRDLTVTGVIEAIPQPSHLADSAGSFMRFDALVSMDVFEPIEKAIRRSVSNVDPGSENWVINTNITYVLLPGDGSFTADAFNTRLKSFGDRRVPKESLKVGFVAKPVSEFLISLADTVLGSTTALLLALGGLVLTVACLNYANLATAQGAGRAKEVGMRKILGAGRGQIVRQYLFEAALYTVIALVIALAAVALALPILKTAGIDLLPILGTSPTFWAFLAAVVAVVSILAGAYPAFALSRLRPIEALRAGRVKIGFRFVTHLLVAAQFAAASFLLIAVIVTYLQNQELKRLVVTTAGDPIVAITNNLGGTGVSMEALRTELVRSPQIRSVSGKSVLPWSLAISPTSVSRSREASSTAFAVGDNLVGHDFFSSLDMRIVAGRVFDDKHSDDLLPADPGSSSSSRAYNVVVDRAMAAQLGWENPQDAIGQTVYLPWLTNASRPPDQVRIIGVVENKPLGLLGPGRVKSNLFRLAPGVANYPVIRIARNDIDGALAAIDAGWQKLAPSIVLKRRFGDELFEQSYAQFEVVNKAVAGLAGFAFIISMMGLFGMATHVTSGRQHEIGIRKTLGASVRQVVSLLLWDFSKPIVIANLVAWPLGFFAMRAYLSIFYQRISLTPLPFLLSLVLTVLVAWMAVGGQTLRAARRKPATVLRYE